LSTFLSLSRSAQRSLILLSILSSNASAEVVARALELRDLRVLAQNLQPLRSRL
jgi:hypothetical protein